MIENKINYGRGQPEEILLTKEAVEAIISGGNVVVDGVKIRMLRRSETHKPKVTGRLKPFFGWKYEGHDVFIVKEIVIDGEHVHIHKDYRVGSKIYKDYNAECMEGCYKMHVIEY